MGAARLRWLYAPLACYRILRIAVTGVAGAVGSEPGPAAAAHYRPGRRRGRARPGRDIADGAASACRHHRLPRPGHLLRSRGPDPPGMAFRLVDVSLLGL